LDRKRKEQVVSELKEVFETSGIIVAANYSGITVAEMSDLRNKMREQNASVRVAKNRLARIAIDGSPAEGMKDLLVDQIGTDPLIDVMKYHSIPLTRKNYLELAFPEGTELTAEIEEQIPEMFRE